MGGRHVEYAIHDRTAKTVAAVLQQVFAGQHRIVVEVELPKATVQHVEMLVREVSVLIVDIVVLVHLMERLEQRALAHAQLTRGDFAAPGHVVPVENAHGDSQRVFVLELAVILQEREAGMCLEQLLDEKVRNPRGRWRSQSAI